MAESAGKKRRENGLSVSRLTVTIVLANLIGLVILLALGASALTGAAVACMPSASVMTGPARVVIVDMRRLLRLSRMAAA